jgi:hypothetical protein
LPDEPLPRMVNFTDTTSTLERSDLARKFFLAEI